MPAPPASGVVAFEAIFTSNGQTVENTFHYHLGTTITTAILTAMAGTYATWMAGHPGFFSNTTQLVKMQLRDLTSTSGASLIVNVTPPLAGNVTSPPLPNNVSYSLKRQTGLRGRANRGRLFMIGLTEGNLQADGQQIVATVPPTFATGYNALMTQQLSDNAATEVILHKATGTITPVTGYAFADLYLDSQRRRLPAHNRHH